MPRQINNRSLDFRVFQGLSNEDLFDLYLETTDNLDEVESEYENAVETCASEEEVYRLLGERDMLEGSLCEIEDERTRREVTDTMTTISYVPISDIVSPFSPQFSHMFERYQEAVMGMSNVVYTREETEENSPLKGIASQYIEDLNL